jgi:hypothetical protein
VYVSLDAAAVVLAGCAVGGTIGVAGVLVGLLVGRRFRELPRVRCVVTDWKLAFDKVGTAPRATCTFEMDMFNEGQLATGVRGISVALRAGERTLVERLMNAASREPLWTIDLPPRRWAHASVYAVLEGEEARVLEGFWRADLAGRFPDGTAFELKIVERKDFVASPKKATSERHDYLANRNFRSRLLARKRIAG